MRSIHGRLLVHISAPSHAPFSLRSVVARQAMSSSIPWKHRAIHQRFCLLKPSFGFRMEASLVVMRRVNTTLQSASTLRLVHLACGIALPHSIPHVNTLLLYNPPAWLRYRCITLSSNECKRSKRGIYELAATSASIAMACWSMGPRI